MLVITFLVSKDHLKVLISISINQKLYAFSNYFKKANFLNT